MSDGCLPIIYPTRPPFVQSIGFRAARGRGTIGGFRDDAAGRVPAVDGVIGGRSVTYY